MDVDTELAMTRDCIKMANFDIEALEELIFLRKHLKELVKQTHELIATANNLNSDLDGWIPLVHSAFMEKLKV